MIPHSVFVALATGFSWFVVFFGVFVIMIVYACKYGNTNKEESCKCVRLDPTACNLCTKDKFIIALQMMALAMILIILIRQGDKIDRVEIQGAKADSFILECVDDSKQQCLKEIDKNKK